MDQLLQAFQDTLTDDVFTRSERQRLTQLIQTYRLDKRKLDWLRSQVFDMARAKAQIPETEKLIDWLENANKTMLEPAQPNTQSRVYFTPGDDCSAVIQAQLQAARDVIKICVFTITDDRISETILRKHQQGVHLKIITDNDKSLDLGSDIARMADAGIDIRTDTTSHHMHHKFALVDNQTALTGSYNWTRSASLHNHENLLITQEPQVVKAYGKEFDDLWKEMLTY